MSTRVERDRLLEEAESALGRLLEKLGAWRLEARIWEAASTGLREEIKVAKKLYETHQALLKDK